MGYQPLEKLLPKAANSIYKLVLLAAKRATELAEGMPKLIDRPLTMKTTTLALEEIMEGKVVLKGCESEACPHAQPVQQKPAQQHLEKKDEK